MNKPSITVWVFVGMIMIAVLGCEQSASYPADQDQIEPAMKVEAVSGYYFQNTETQALQDDNFANPGMLWVDQGAQLWSLPPGDNAPACQTCHEQAESSMQGVAAGYPKWSQDTASLLNLEARINTCREQHQGQQPWPYEHPDLLALSAFVAYQSQGQPIQVDISGAARKHFEAGREYFYTRRGQMDLACHHCHEQHVGQMLRGDLLSQGQPTGYPMYRLEWQSLGSLQRRLRFCNTGVRAEPFDYGDPAYLDLELFLAWRAQGLPVETPAVRR